MLWVCPVSNSIWDNIPIISLSNSLQELLKWLIAYMHAWNQTFECHFNKCLTIIKTHSVPIMEMTFCIQDKLSPFPYPYMYLPHPYRPSPTPCQPALRYTNARTYRPTVFSPARPLFQRQRIKTRPCSQPVDRSSQNVSFAAETTLQLFDLTMSNFSPKWKPTLGESAMRKTTIFPRLWEQNALMGAATALATLDPHSAVGFGNNWQNPLSWLAYKMNIIMKFAQSFG